MKKKLRVTIRKIQEGTIEIECDSDSTIAELNERIEQMSEEEIGFSDPEYHLMLICDENDKISKIIWRSKTL